ncbi:MAG: hypothetical protein OEN55_14545, partial [Alphaproteobacteria bacterium]|nr:hypothetical protein [Alphaproteobacteria bacterium]
MQSANARLQEMLDDTAGRRGDRTRATGAGLRDIMEATAAAGRHARRAARRRRAERYVRDGQTLA